MEISKTIASSFTGSYVVSGWKQGQAKTRFTRSRKNPPTFFFLCTFHGIFTIHKTLCTLLALGNALSTRDKVIVITWVWKDAFWFWTWHCKKNTSNTWIYFVSLQYFCTNCNSKIKDSSDKLQKQLSEVFYKKSCSLKFRKIYRKTPVPESLF